MNDVMKREKGKRRGAQLLDEQCKRHTEVRVRHEQAL